MPESAGGGRVSEEGAVVCAQVQPTPGGAFDAAVREAPRAQEGIRRRQSARDTAARTYARALPLVPVRARGLTIEGADGRRYLDCTSGAGALALGHNHPVVLEAIRAVLDSGAPLNAIDLATPVTETFLEELHRTLPPGLAHRAHVRFCDPSTGDALETACRWARATTGRTGLMTFTEAHRRAAFQPYDPCAAAQPTAALAGLRDPHYPDGLADGRELDLAADWAESLLDTPSTGGVLPAGVIVEPVQGASGVLPVPGAWLRRIRRLTADRSIPLIVDETHTGFGRTGAFWAVGDSGVTPDVMILSPDIGGSLPLAVVIQRDELSGEQPAADTAPFRGNQLAMAAGAATLAHVRENGLAERAAHLGARMLAQLRLLAEESPIVARVRGRGLLIGVELVATEEAVEAVEAEEAVEAGEAPTADAGALGQCGAAGTGPGSASALAAALQRECLRRGLIIGLGGHGGSVRLSPPLTITDEQATAVLDRLADAVEAVARAHGAARQQRRHRIRR